MTHVDGCDGFRFSHLVRVVHVSSVGRGMWQARCEVEPCRWEGTLVGPGAMTLAQREAREHSREVPCDGRCARW